MSSDRMSTLQPSREDRFSFGLWTVGWQARDPFGDATRPTRGAGETLDDLLADRSTFEDFDADAAGEQGYGYVRLSQLALEHLLGAR